MNWYNTVPYAHTWMGIVHTMYAMVSIRACHASWPCLALLAHTYTFRLVQILARNHACQGYTVTVHTLMHTHASETKLHTRVPDDEEQPPLAWRLPICRGVSARGVIVMR